MPDPLIKLAQSLGLIYASLKNPGNELLAISELGRDLIKLKQEHSDRFSDEQGKFILSILIRNPDALNSIASVLRIFSSAGNGDLAISGEDQRIKDNESKALRILQQLRVARYDDGKIIIENKVINWLQETMSLDSDMDQEMLLNLLEQRRKNGAIAEQFVLEAEKKD